MCCCFSPTELWSKHKAFHSSSGCLIFSHCSFSKSGVSCTEDVVLAHTHLEWLWTLGALVYMPFPSQTCIGPSKYISMSWIRNCWKTISPPYLAGHEYDEWGIELIVPCSSIIFMFSATEASGTHYLEWRMMFVDLTDWNLFDK